MNWNKQISLRSLVNDSVMTFRRFFELLFCKTLRKLDENLNNRNEKKKWTNRINLNKIINKTISKNKN